MMTLLPLERPGEWLEDKFLLTLLVESGLNAVSLASTARYYSRETQVHKDRNLKIQTWRNVSVPRSGTT